MSAISGRSIRIKIDGSTVMGARTDSLTVTINSVDDTDKEDDGWQSSLDIPASRTVTAEVSGYIKSDLVAGAVGTLAIDACECVILGYGRVDGTAILTNLAHSGGHDGTADFTATLNFTGPAQWKFPPAFTSNPTIAGATTEGATITVTPGTVSASPAATMAYQWQEDDGAEFVDITGETSLTFTTGAGQVGNNIRCRQRATNTEGVTDAFSNTLGPITA